MSDDQIAQIGGLSRLPDKAFLGRKINMTIRPGVSGGFKTCNKPKDLKHGKH